MEKVRKKTIRDVDVAGKKVLIRVDYNVPMDAEQKIIDDTRIVETLPTINYLLEHKIYVEDANMAKSVYLNSLFYYLSHI